MGLIFRNFPLGLFLLSPIDFESLALSQSLMTLSIFSCGCLSFVHLLRRNVRWDLLPIFMVSIYFVLTFFSWFIYRSMYILWYLIELLWGDNFELFARQIVVISFLELVTGLLSFLLVVSHWPGFLWSLQPCMDVCAVEGANTLLIYSFSR